MTTLQIIILTMMVSVGLFVSGLITGFLLCKINKPKIYHGHFTPVPEKEEEKVQKPSKVDLINKAFGVKR